MGDRMRGCADITAAPFDTFVEASDPELCEGSAFCKATVVCARAMLPADKNISRKKKLM
jgi:hypothetical protein